MSSDVLPCLNNIHWISISLGVKAKVLPKAQTTLHNLHPPPCYLSDLSSYNSPFHSSPVTLVFLVSTEMPDMQLGPLDLLGPLPGVLPHPDIHMAWSHFLQVFVILSVRASLATLPTIAPPLHADIFCSSSLPDFSL